MQGGPARRAAAQLDRHQRHARLIQKRGERPPHRLAARRRERIQKVARRRVAPRVLAEVSLDAALERILAHPVLEHADHRLAFAVGDTVESVGDVVVAFDGLADLPRGYQSVAAHRAHAYVLLVDHGVPLRLPMANDFGIHPGGERFVEPDVVPPGSGHQVTKPLMRHLVRNDQCVFALAVDAILRRVAQHKALHAGNQPGILHRAAK